MFDQEELSGDGEGEEEEESDPDINEQGEVPSTEFWIGCKVALEDGFMEMEAFVEFLKEECFLDSSQVSIEIEDEVNVNI